MIKERRQGISAVVKLEHIDAYRLGKLCYLVALFSYIWYETLKLSMLLYVIPEWGMNVFRFGVLALLFASEALSLMTYIISGKWRDIVGKAPAIRNSNFLKVAYAVVLLGAAVVAFVLSDVFFPVYTALFIVGARDYDFETISRWALAALISCTSFCVAACMCGITENYVWIQGEGTRIRYGLGFRYATYLSHLVLYSCLLLLYIRKGRLKTWELIVSLIISITVYLYTNSRNSFVLVLISIIIAIPVSRLHINEKHSKILSCMAPIAFLLLVFGSIISMLLYDQSNQLLSHANVILGNRISIAHGTYAEEGISLLGQSIEMHGNALSESGSVIREGRISFVDNSYCNILLQDGLVLFLLFVFAEAALIRNVAKQKKMIVLTILAIVAVHSAIDPWFIQTNINVFIVLIGTELLRPKFELAE